MIINLIPRCGSNRHALPRCKKRPNPSNPLPFALCFVCSQKGHLASSCAQGKGIYPDGGCCKLCGKKTHLAKDCGLRNEGTAPFLVSENMCLWIIFSEQNWPLRRQCSYRKRRGDRDSGISGLTKMTFIHSSGGRSRWREMRSGRNALRGRLRDGRRWTLSHDCHLLHRSREPWRRLFRRGRQRSLYSRASCSYTDYAYTLIIIIIIYVEQMFSGTSYPSKSSLATLVRNMIQL
jgi:hypothetical protein